MEANRYKRVDERNERDGKIILNRKILISVIE